MMAAAEVSTSAEVWVEKFTKVDKRHLSNVRRLRSEVRASEGMDPIEQAILGTTGSPEQLAKYQAVVQKIGNLAGQPIMYIREIDQGRILKLTSGVLTGVVTAEQTNNTYGAIDRNPTVFYGNLHAQVDPLMNYSYYRHDAHDNYYFNDQATTPRVGRAVAIANFALAEGNNMDLDPSADYRNGIEENQLLIGSKAVFDHKLFQEGLSTILLHLQAGDPREQL